MAKKAGSKAQVAPKVPKVKAGTPKPEAAAVKAAREGLRTVSTHLLAVIRESGADFVWLELVPPMVDWLKAAPAPAKSNRAPARSPLAGLRAFTYELAGYRTGAYARGTRSEEVQAGVVALYEQQERSVQFESAVTWAGKAAVLSAGGVLTLSKAKGKDGRTYLVAPWSEVQPEVIGPDGEKHRNKSAEPVRVTVRFINALYALKGPGVTRRRTPKGDAIARTVQAASEADAAPAELAKVADALPSAALAASAQGHVSRYATALASALGVVGPGGLTGTDWQALHALGLAIQAAEGLREVKRPIRMAPRPRKAA